MSESQFDFENDQKKQKQHRQFLIDEYNYRKAVIAELGVVPTDTVQDTHVYVLTNSSYKVSRYKIGIHTGSLAKLKSRYKTYLVEVNVIRFVKITNAASHEKNLHRIFQDDRMDNTEWFQTDYDTLILKFDEYMCLLGDHTVKHQISNKEQCLINTLLEIISGIDSPKHITAETRGKLYKAIKQIPKPDVINHV